MPIDLNEHLKRKRAQIHDKPDSKKEDKNTDKNDGGGIT